MNVELVNRIKRLVVIALASDDQLMEQLVLKGGNAIDLVYNRANQKLSRASYDLDYSIEGGDFNVEDLNEIKTRIEQALIQTFRENGFELLDFRFSERPKKPNEKTGDFWGGYLITFKLLQQNKFEKLRGDHKKAITNAIPVKSNNSPTFEVEISKYEYIGQKIEANIDGYTIYVYSPEMIAFEKVRALCQQLPQYSEIVPSHTPRARARDFYDIYLIMETQDIDINDKKNVELLSDIFYAKKVPIDFIKHLRAHLLFHKENWASVVDTLPHDEDLNDFDFYAEYVLKNFEPLTFL